MTTKSCMHERFRQLSAPRVSAEAAIDPPAPVDTTFDLELIEILRRPVAGTTSQDAHRQKEEEIGEAFAKLTPVEACALYRRLASPSASDELARAFGRLIIERRIRLLTFLGDARRRAANAQTDRAVREHATAAGCAR